jgi:hypothetical protein
MQQAAGSRQQLSGSRWRNLCLRKGFYCLLLSAFCLLPFQAQAQSVVDKMVATVNSGGVRPSLITYSDLLWQLALQPDTPIENPSSENLNRALNLIISQRLILQEAEKLPTVAPTDEEIKNSREELVKQFPSTEFQQRAERVGLSGDQLREIVRERLTIEKYLNFRFRSFTVVTQKEVEDYYREVWVPRFRRQQPGILVPELNGTYDKQLVSKLVETELTESKIESDTDEFLDSTRERAEVIILNPV